MKIHYGRGKVWSGKGLSGEMSGQKSLHWGNVQLEVSPSGKCLFGEYPVRGNACRGSVSWGTVHSGNCHTIINSMSVSVKCFNFTLVSFKAACNAILILVQKENEHDQTHIFQDIYSESCQIHQLAIMYHLEGTNQDIHLRFYFEIFTNSFRVL